MSMNDPIIIYENGDFLFFDSVREAADYLEPIDVKNNEYTAYDVNGRLVDLKIVAESERGFLGISREAERVVFCLRPETDTTGLSKKIATYLRNVGIVDIGEDASLPDLVDKLRTFLQR